MFKYIIPFLFLFTARTFAQNATAYRIFTGEGKQVSYRKMVRKIAQPGVILFGEVHDNALAHWLELQVLKDLYARHSRLLLAMEMLEADDQRLLDEYLGGTTDEKKFTEEAGVWNNYKTDYRPLVAFARQKKLKVVASNIPRRYASLVYRKGLPALDTLPAETKQWMAPLPIEVDLDLPGYKNMLAGMSEHSHGDPANLARAQAVKDATMAHFILQHNDTDNVIFHINGAYHSQDHEGIVWYLRKARPGIHVVTIHVAEQDAVEKLEGDNKHKADFIICIPADMTKTY